MIQPAIGELMTEQATNIFVNVSLPEEQFIQLKEQNQQFMDRHSNINVFLTNEEPKDDAYLMWTEQIEQGYSADIMLIDNGWIKPFAVRGYLKPVDNIMIGDALSDQLARLLDPLKWNGYLWGVPRDVNPYAVMWNTDLLNEAGLDEPPADWASFQEISEALTGQDVNRKIVNFSSGDLQQLIVWEERFQAKNPGIINLRSLSQEQVERLAWLQTMSEYTSNIQLEQLYIINEMVAENRLLAFIAPWDSLEKLTSGVRSKLAVDRKSVIYPWLNGRSYVVSSRSKADKEALLWVQEITETTNQPHSYDWHKLLPTKASIYDSYSSDFQAPAFVTSEWWLKALNTKLPEEQLVQPDPQWPARWLQWERYWRQYTADGLHLDAFLQAVKTE